MATIDPAKQQQIYLGSDNGKPHVQFGSGYNTPYGYQKIDYAGLGQAAKQQLDYLKGQIQLFTSRYGANSSSPGANTLDYIKQYNDLGGDTAYQQLSSGQHTPDLIAKIFPQLDRNQLNQFASGQSVDSGYVTDPVTGNMTTQKAIDGQAANEAGVANGSLRKVPVGNGFGYVPTGSAADLSLQGKSYEQQLASPTVQQQIKDQNLTPVNPNTQTATPISSVPISSVGMGIKANTPQDNVSSPSNTLPSNQMSTGSPSITSSSTPQGNTGALNTTGGVQPPKPLLASNSGQYTPPNQGTTGVSQGGIVGNLINYAQNETPQVRQAREDYKKLQEDYGTQNADIQSRPMGLTQQTGQQGILASLFAQKQVAAQDALQNALASQAQQITATQSAGSLNAPQYVSPGQVQISPTGQLLGGTTSGAANLNALVGMRASASNPQVQEYFNKDTGQGFSSPQQLADYVNTQLGSNIANAQNVFDIIKQYGSGGSNITGGNSALNPLSQIPQLAQRVLSGQMSYQDALNAGSSIPGFASALQASLFGQNSGANLNALEGQSGAIQNITGQQQGQIANFTSLKQQAQRLGSDISSLITKNNINPSDINKVNELIQRVAGNVSDPNYATFRALLTDIGALYSNLLGTGGNTDYQTSLGQGQLPPGMNGQGLISLLNNLDYIAQSKISAINTAPSTYTTPSSTGSNYDAIINKYR